MRKTCRTSFARQTVSSSHIFTTAFPRDRASQGWAVEVVVSRELEVVVVGAKNQGLGSLPPKRSPFIHARTRHPYSTPSSLFTAILKIFANRYVAHWLGLVRMSLSQY